MSCHSRGLAVGGHDDCFLIVDRVGQDFVVGVRAHTGEVSTVYLMDVDIEKLVKFLSEKRDVPAAEMRLLPARHTVGETVIGFSETGD
jgi:hypothetical protein